MSSDDTRQGQQVGGEVVLYEAPGGEVHLDVRLERDSLWLSLTQLAELFERDKSVISRHLRNIFEEGELDRKATVAKNATVQDEGGRTVTRNVEYYNLDAIISVGYRVNSKRGTQFRIWATDVLRSHLVKGYTVNAARLRDLNRGLRPRVLRGPGAAHRLPARHAARRRRGAGAGRGRPHAPQVPGAAAGRDHEARHHRRAAPRHQARPAPPRPLLRHAVARATQGAERYAANRFSVTRQLRYSRDETQLALDLGLFINGLPVATFELKNSLTKQTVEDAVQQYKRDRDPREKLFEFGRCVVHFAVDEHEVRFCTHLKGKARGSCPSTGAGTTAPATRRTRRPQDRLPLEADPHPAGLTDILENYAQIVETRTRRPARSGSDADLAALPPARRGAPAAGRRRASTARAALPDPALGRQRQVELHRLAGAPADRAGAKDEAEVFDSIIVVTDRRILDQQIRTRSSSSRRWAPRSGTPSARATCGASSREGKKIIIRRCRSSPSSWTRSAASTGAGASRSSSTRRTPARAGARRRRCRWRSPRPGRGGRRDDRGHDQPADGGRRSCCPTPATSPSPPRPRTRRWRSSASPTPQADGTVRTARSTATP
jgi:hypothetical protein